MSDCLLTVLRLPCYENYPCSLGLLLLTFQENNALKGSKVTLKLIKFQGFVRENGDQKGHTVIRSQQLQHQGE